MSLLHGFGDGVSKSTRSWIAWARKHAKEIGDAGMRHIERQDLLAERQRVLNALGSRVVERFADETAKSITRNSPGVRDLLDHVSRNDARLVELSAEETSENASDA